VPKHAYGATPDQLADLWVAEFAHGIEDTGVKPGFIKIGIDEIKDSSDRLSMKNLCGLLRERLD
jgi:phosphotriesterase-related protein